MRSGHCRSRPRSIAIQALECTSQILGIPKPLTVLSVEGKQLFFVLAGNFGMNENPTVGDHRRAVPFADRLPPKNFRGRGPRGDLFRGGVITIRTEPLRPIRCPTEKRGKQQNGPRTLPTHSKIPILSPHSPKEPRTQ